ncbi:MAG: hypothetical protein IJ694_02080 [Acidaminococcaceae bacterium]|nr:hypothetical protein [Acidaminococcaceae bacterium]MBR1661046.1 hypothetical protein [Acidaminococcaceae bacterium]
MARIKKDGKRVNFLMKSSVIDKLERYCDEVGQTRTEATERILNRYLETYFTKKNNNKSAESDFGLGIME